MSTNVHDLPPIVERFLRYVRIDTQADPQSATVPSSTRQLDLSRLLKAELDALGVSAHMDEHGYVYAVVPALGDRSGVKLGLVAHVDTSPDEPGGPVRPIVHEAYQGGTVTLPGDPQVTLDPARQPALLDHVGHQLITSDGTTLLGSDDKAGVALIMQLVDDVLALNLPIPELRVLFTVDEEIGRGVDHLDMSRFSADVAYTVDGGGMGVVYDETFHAAEAVVAIRGVNVHPGYAYGTMVNAVRIAADLISAFPPKDAPETSRGRDGYLHPHRVTADDPGTARVEVLLRDFEQQGLERRKEWLVEVIDELKTKYPDAIIDLSIEDRYRNMRSYIDEIDPRTVSVAVAAGEDIGVEVRTAPVRGGTDGARLSEMGIPTPNLFTGGYDFHSRFEWNTVENLNVALTYLKAVVHRWSQLPPR